MIDPMKRRSGVVAFTAEREPGGRAGGTRRRARRRRRSTAGVVRPTTVGTQAHRNERGTRRRSTARPCCAPSGSVTGSSGKPRVRVVVAVQPRDRQEVRHLPQEDDREQRPGLDATACPWPRPSRSSAAARRERRRRRSRTTSALERRVDEDVASASVTSATSIDERVGADREHRAGPVSDSAHREPAGLERAEAPVGHRPQARALHQAIGVALEHLVHRRRAAGDEGRAADGREGRRATTRRGRRRGRTRPRPSRRRGS